MPQPHILKIVEIFPSIQGEGLRQGEPTIFIRLSGCNLNCYFCDTKYAWKEGKEFSKEQILEKIKKIRSRFVAHWVCLTGGEPLLQNVTELVKELKKQNFKVQIETNSTLFHPLPVDWYSISPKPDKYYFHPKYRENAKEVKLVVIKNLDFEVVRRLRRKFPEKIPLFLQPQSNKKWSMSLGVKLLRRAFKAELKNIRISVQLHKVMGLR